MPAKKKESGVFNSQMDPRLDLFSPIPVRVDFERTFQKEFFPKDVASSTKVFTIQSDSAFLDPNSIVLKISGRIMIRNADGTESIIPPLQRSTKLTVSFQCTLQYTCVLNTLFRKPATMCPLLRHYRTATAKKESSYAAKKSCAKRR